MSHNETVGNFQRENVLENVRCFKGFAKFPPCRLWVVKCQKLMHKFSTKLVLVDFRKFCCALFCFCKGVHRVLRTWITYVNLVLSSSECSHFVMNTNKTFNLVGKTVVSQVETQIREIFPSVRRRVIPTANRQRFPINNTRGFKNSSSQLNIVPRSYSGGILYRT